MPRKSVGFTFYLFRQFRFRVLSSFAWGFNKKSTAAPLFRASAQEAEWPPTISSHPNRFGANENFRASDGVAGKPLKKDA
jgi:hypothetical protein